MKIGIDISQLAYKDTGVGKYLESLVTNLVKADQDNEYVLFFSSLRKRIQNSKFKIQNYNSKVKIKEYRFPSTLLDLLWNKLHIVPIEWLVGDIDVFITSDWTEPPTKHGKKATIIYDLTIYKVPQEMNKKIINTQKRKLKWVKKESDLILCISEATKRDAMEILGIDKDKLKVIYPGL